MDDTSKNTNRNVLQIYCINLKERPDRWNRFLHQPAVQTLQKKYPFQRFEGVNGKLLDIKNDDRVSLRTKRNIMYQKRRDHEDLDTPGGVGCYLSHYGTWKKFLDSNAERCLIFEDDAVIPDDFLEVFEAALEDEYQENKVRPDIWLLSTPFGSRMKKALEVEDIQYNGNWGYDIVGPLTGYVLTRSGAQILSENAFPIDGHVDHYMHRCAQMGMLVMAHNKTISLRQHRMFKKDSDIQEKSKCEICDIPYTPHKSGFLVLTNQTMAALTAAGVSIAALFLLRHFKDL